MWLTCLVPSRFLCRYPLRLGATIFAIILICTKIACIIVITTEMVDFAKCESCTRTVLRSAYGFSGTAIIYCIIMICMHLLLIWAIRRGNCSMVLIWVVVTSMWLLQTFSLTLVLFCLFMADASFTTWILCLIFGIIGFGHGYWYVFYTLNECAFYYLCTVNIKSIAAYAISVGFGLWLELKPLTTRTI